MGDEEGLDVGLLVPEIGDVGDDEIDAEHLLVGEHQAAVDDDDVVAVLEDEHVLADLAHPAERDDPEGRAARQWCLLSGHGGPGSDQKKVGASSAVSTGLASGGGGAGNASGAAACSGRASPVAAPVAAVAAVATRRRRASRRAAGMPAASS